MKAVCRHPEFKLPNRHVLRQSKDTGWRRLQRRKGVPNVPEPCPARIRRDCVASHPVFESTIQLSSRFDNLFAKVLRGIQTSHHRNWYMHGYASRPPNDVHSKSHERMQRGCLRLSTIVQRFGTSRDKLQTLKDVPSFKHAVSCAAPTTHVLDSPTMRIVRAPYMTSMKNEEVMG